MARIYRNDKDFKIIELSVDEYNIIAKSDTDDVHCGVCANQVIDYIYYLACNNDYLCYECLIDYIDNMRHYADANSIRVESTYYNKMLNKIHNELNLDL